MSSTVYLDNTNNSITRARSDLKAIDVCHLDEVSGADRDRTAISERIETSRIGRSHVITLVGCVIKNSRNEDSALARCGSSSHNCKVLKHCLRTDVVDSADFVIEREAVINETTFDEPSGDSGRIVMTMCYPTGSLSCGS